MRKKIMKYNYKKYELIHIFWLDSVHDSGWRRDSEYEDENEIEYETVGFFLRETKRAIQVVQSKCLKTSIENDYLVDAMMQIPKVSIYKIKSP